MLPRKWREQSGKMNTGTTIEKTKTEIASIIRKFETIHGVFGFGSFFRLGKFNDVDLLIVIEPIDKSPLETYYACKSKLDDLGIKLNLTFDITFINEHEFIDCPLLELSNLTKIFKKK